MEEYLRIERHWANLPTPTDLIEQRKLLILLNRLQEQMTPEEDRELRQAPPPRDDWR